MHLGMNDFVCSSFWLPLPTQLFSEQGLVGQKFVTLREFLKNEENVFYVVNLLVYHSEIDLTPEARQCVAQLLQPLVADFVPEKQLEERLLRRQFQHLTPIL